MQSIEPKINGIAKIVEKLNNEMGISLVKFARLLFEYAELIQNGSMTAARPAYDGLLQQRINGHIKEEGQLARLLPKFKHVTPALLSELVKQIPDCLRKDIENVLGPKPANNAFGRFFKPAQTPTDEARVALIECGLTWEQDKLKGQQGFKKK